MDFEYCGVVLVKWANSTQLTKSREAGSRAGSTLCEFRTQHWLRIWP